jgi:hypothetical protein
MYVIKFLLAFSVVGFTSSVALAALPAAGIDYSSNAVPSISSWAIRDENPYSTTLEKASLTAPANGYVVVSVTGSGCLWKEGKYIEVWLSNKSDNSAFHWLGDGSIFSIANNTGSDQACGVGQSQSFSFQYIQAVKSLTTYTFYLKGHRGDSLADGNFSASRLLLTYYPTRY